MSNWTAGYVADIGYTFGYYTELNPLRIKLAFLNAGLHFPEVGTACELGFGQGMSVNIHAAASVTSWSATDFNPSQASFAQEVAQVSGANAQLFDDAFADFANRADLPDFDYIGLHGIWSWISDENRAVIVDFIKRKLKVGGVLYISYNTQPGWAAMMPMRDLLTEYADVMGRQGAGIANRIDEALAFTDKLMTTNPSYFKANPGIANRIEQMKKQPRNYLAHEYFNKDWLPMPFSKMAEWLAPAKVQFACSAHYLEHVDTLNLTAEQQQFLAEIPDTMLKQSVRDFMVNQQFRKDYWVKGARRLTNLQRQQALEAQKVMLCVPADDVKLEVAGSLGKATMSESIYKPILAQLSDYSVQTVEQIHQAVKAQNIHFAQVLQAILILTGNGSVSVVQDEDKITQSKHTTAKLNAYLMKHAQSSNEIACLASPVTGGGIAVGRFQQLFLQAYQSGKTQATEMAEEVWLILAAQNQRLQKEGKALASAEENLAELIEQAQSFHDKQLPIMKALQVV